MTGSSKGQQRMATSLLWTLVLVVHMFCGLSSASRKEGQEQDVWRRQTLEELRHALSVARLQNKNLARNIILFIGDGMGISTVTASRIRAGQLRDEPGEENLLYFERFPHVGLIKTYSADSQVTCSAAAGSAILTGVKINSGVIGCDSRVEKGNCSQYNERTRLKTILHQFVQEGLSTGIVTTSRVTHATPAAAYASTPQREWEGDVNMLSDEDAQNCSHVDDLAKQLIRNNSDIKVILGGGRRYFLDNSTEDPETHIVSPYHRQDGNNLIEEWKEDKEARNATYSYVWTRDQLMNLSSETEFLLGLFNPSHMDFDRVANNEPSLAEMTEKAIGILRKDQEGFFLLVEGARIDFGHHSNSAYTAITETLDFNEAVEVAARLTDPEDTLIIVTADHSHAFNIQGYSSKGNDILGFADPGPYSGPLDDLPYTTLAYTNGPVYGRVDLTNRDTASPNFRQAGCIPFSAETHAGEDVAVYAMGPMAHLFHATHEQHYIYQVMEYGACVGRSKRYCTNSKSHNRKKIKG
ncbi:alkaline phosphatase tissue-nonspecific isozyme [Biomphalaria glabrata]|nr:alkaline phosphatase; tissue-nonspecific isozyme [Biomphalaria glabrata]